MKELFIGIFISLLFLLYGIWGFGKFAKKISLIDSSIVFIGTLIICLVLKRPDVLKLAILIFVLLSVLIDMIVENVRQNEH